MNAGRKAKVQFGVNLNNREPLIAPDYDLPALLDLSERVERLGFDSVWVGDSLFSKPRYESISLLSAISQRTERVRLGTACLISTQRNPLVLSMEWSTLDQLSGGRTIFGPCMGSAEVRVREEYKALGLPFKERATIFEEGLEIVRALWTEGKVDFHGKFFDYDDIAFHSGTEMAPLMPIQKPPPTWIVSNPRLIDESHDERMVNIMKRACRRIIEYGDGWMTCCRAQHPEELTEQLGYLTEAASELGKDFSDYEVAYQVTMNVGDSEESANVAFDEYISKYYPELSQNMDLSNWGPVGEPEQIAAWLREFADRGVTHFICRFGDLDQVGQVERFASEVLPAFEREMAR